MLFSLVIAFTITPWAAIRVLKRCLGNVGASAHDHDAARRDWFTRLYYRMMRPLLERRRWRWSFLVVIVVFLLEAIGLVRISAVEVTMLPFDNKSEFQVILNTPEGTTLEETTRIAQEMADAIRREPVGAFSIWLNG